MNLPEGWQIKKLGDVCQVIAGQSPESKYYNNEGIGLPFYQGKKEFTDKYIGSPQTWTTKITKEALSDDILMSVRAPVGPINFATEKVCIGRGLAAIRAGEKINLDFLFYILLAKQKEIKGTEGAVFASINKGQIESITIPIPSLEVQKRIVEILDEAFEGLGRSIELTKQNLINARELFDSYLNNIFTTKGDDWLEKKLGEVCTLQRGYDLPKQMRQKGNYPLVSSSGITDSHIEGKVKAPGVVTGRSGSIGNVFFIEEDYWPLNTVLYVKDFHNNDPEFIYYLLDHFNLGKYASGTGVPTLNRNHVHEVNVNIPKSIKIQENIVLKLNKLIPETQRLEGIYKRKLKLLEELKQSILERAFRGELTANK